MGNPQSPAVSVPQSEHVQTDPVGPEQPIVLGVVAATLLLALPVLLVQNRKLQASRQAALPPLA